jgi:acyl dehydratase
MDSVGKSAGQDGVIAHGMLVMGFIGEAITNWIPNRNLKRFGVRFIAVSKPGDIITVAGKVTEKKVRDGKEVIICEVAAKDQNQQVKASGFFEALL